MLEPQHWGDELHAVPGVPQQIMPAEVVPQVVPGTQSWLPEHGVPIGNSQIGPKPVPTHVEPPAHAGPVAQQG